MKAKYTTVYTRTKCRRFAFIGLTEVGVQVEPDQESRDSPITI